MKTVKLKQPTLIDHKHYNEGDVVVLPNERAHHIVSSGSGEYHDSQDVANPDANPLADAIDPMPPEVVHVNPVDATAPKVADNPGLVDLVNATDKGDEVATGGSTAGMTPVASGDASIKTATRKPGDRSASNLQGKAE